MIAFDDRLLDTSRLDPDAFYMLMLIASYMGNNEFAWPSNAELEKRSGWSENKVSSVKKRLYKTGIVKAFKRFKKDTGEQTSNGYQITTDEVMFMYSMKGKMQYFTDQTTPPNFTPPPPPNLGGGNSISLETTTTKSSSIPKPKGSGENEPAWTKKVATLFDEIMPSLFQENGLFYEALVWEASAGQFFAALKKLRKIFADRAKEQKKEFTDEYELEAWTAFFTFGFKFLHSVWEAKGGTLTVTPPILLRNYNQIVSYARQIKGGKSASATKRNAVAQLMGDLEGLDI